MSLDLNKIYDTIKTQISALPAVQAHLVSSAVDSSVEHFTLPQFPPEKMPNFKDMLQERPNDIVLQDLVKYNVNILEVYEVIDDFDKSPNNLSKEKAELRKKYLNIILSIMDDRNNMMKNILSQMANSQVWTKPNPGSIEMTTLDARVLRFIGGNSDPRMKEIFLLYGLGNYDPAFDTIKRIIKLLIMEIDLNGTTSCQTCPTCPTCQTCPACQTCQTCQTCPTCPACQTCDVCPANNDNMYIGIIVVSIIILVIMGIVLSMGKS
jgi:hypothetical protein